MFTNIPTAMRRVTALLACSISIALLAVTAQAQNTPATLNLQQASQRALDNHPDLAAFQWQQQAIDARRNNAAQRPAYELAVDVDNVLGSGDYRSAEQHELSLSLSSLIETGGKRQARLAVLDAESDTLQAEKHARALDILAQINTLYISTLALQEKRALARSATELAERSYSVLNQWANKGAAAGADVLRAKAALSQAKLHEAAIANRYKNQKRELAALWGETRLDFSALTGDLYGFTALENLQTLYQRMQQSPAIQIYASKERLQQASIQLAQSQAATDIRWQIGVTRFQENGDAALSAGFSVPLFSSKRQLADIRVAEAERSLLQANRQTALLNLHTRLATAYDARLQQMAAVDVLRYEIIPALQSAQDKTFEAYQQGRYSYINWLSVQNELLQARLALIDAAVDVWLNQTLIEQLTASAPADNTAALTR